MRRHWVGKRKFRRKFNRFSHRIHKKNIVSGYRGGIRL